MEEKGKKEGLYSCPACGSTSFIDEGLANYRDSVRISMIKTGMTIEGGSPELDIIKSTIKCAKCGKDFL